MGFAVGTSGLAFLRGLWTGWRNQRQSGWLIILEAVLILLFLLELLLFSWVIITPAAPPASRIVQRLHTVEPAERKEMFRSFDPFFPAETGSGSQSGPNMQPVRLFGIHLSKTSGLSSAVMATAEGAQHSYAVGDEVTPGVVLKQVAVDHVVISRDGRDEKLVLAPHVPGTDNASTQAPPDATSPNIPDPVSNMANDAQAEAAAHYDRGGPPPPAGLATADAPLTRSGAKNLKNDLGLDLRTDGGTVTGLVVSPKGPAFAAHGFQRGDIIVAINGTAVTGANSITALHSAMKPGARVPVRIERGASEITMVIWVPAQ